MMLRSVINFIRTLLVLATAIGCIAITPGRAMAQAAADAPASAPTSSAAFLASQKSDFAKGAASATQQIHVLLSNLVDAAVDASSGVMSQANKFAWGLGVISLVLV